MSQLPRLPVSIRMIQPRSFYMIQYSARNCWVFSDRCPNFHSVDVPTSRRTSTVSMSQLRGDGTLEVGTLKFGHPSRIAHRLSRNRLNRRATIQHPDSDKQVCRKSGMLIESVPAKRLGSGDGSPDCCLSQVRLSAGKRGYHISRWQNPCPFDTLLFSVLAPSRRLESLKAGRQMRGKILR
jgi:hypothetical protein